MRGAGVLERGIGGGLFLVRERSEEDIQVARLCIRLLAGYLTPNLGWRGVKPLTFPSIREYF